jgi:hypothetical protein
MGIASGAPLGPVQEILKVIRPQARTNKRAAKIAIASARQGSMLDQIF